VNIAPADDGYEADAERRFGGLRRLYGAATYDQLRGLHVAVVGVGGVGSWAVEALARSGVARLTLVDMDHIAESNINRQVQALSATVGQAKIDALRERIAQIHPGCQVHTLDDFVTADNWPLEAVTQTDVVIDACDDARAKRTMAQWALAQQRPLVIVGAAGGKRAPQRTEVGDLVDVTHDPLLAGLRQGLRKCGALPPAPAAKSAKRSGLSCVFSREPVAAPQGDDACATDGSLNCHGYGSTVTVTAAFGLAAAAHAIELGVALQRA
jgi:tRNA threonylcarbamoyladenosine dehydratase